ncbi:MAG: Crp/Fnr family transcriptional regulator [Deltaproteobacteria bacterium]|nr:Crp/Fnr family transcriptional regulator [Deltaproteobacteria bacterium]
MYEELLRRVSIFEGLRDKEITKLSKLLAEKVFPKDQLIVSHDEVGDSLFIIVEGRVKVVLFSESGREMILSIFKKNDFFGEMSLFDNHPRSANVIAMKKSKVLILKRDDFVDFLKSSPVATLNILAEMSRRLRRADEIISNLALLDVYGRVARVLLHLADQEGKEVEDGLAIHSRPTQQDIASMAGTSRETVSRALSEFQRRGLIETTGRSILLKHAFLLEHSG